MAWLLEATRWSSTEKKTSFMWVAADGSGLTAHAVVVRNLMKEVEVFAPGTWLLAGGGDLVSSLAVLAWIGVLLAVPLFNRRRQRIGDIIASLGKIIRKQILQLIRPMQ